MGFFFVPVLSIAEEVVKEGEKEMDRRERKKVTQLKIIGFNSSEELAYSRLGLIVVRSFVKS